MKLTIAGLAMALAAAHAGAAQPPTDSYPDRPLRIVVPFAPGGVADATARLIAAELTSRLGQQVIVDNRPGGATIIGTQRVTGSPADGYTLLLGSTNVATNAALYTSLPYDTERDLAPVALAVTIPGALITHPSLPVETLDELVAYAQANPGKISYATVGQGSFSHLAVEGLMQQTDTEMTHIPYKGYAPAITSVLAGETQLLASDLQGAMQYLQAGRLKAVAVTSRSRVEVVPDVPTVAEQGVQGYDALGWLGILAPGGTPQAVIDRLNREITDAMNQPEVIERYRAMGIDVFRGGPEAFRSFLDTNQAAWKQVIETADISLD